MMKSILFRMEFHRNVRALILWTVIICALVFFTMSLFSSVLQYKEQILTMINLVPAAAMKARGFGNINDMFSGLGFYVANNVVYMMLLGSIYSIILTSNMLLKEEYGKTAEYLMSRPISRDEIFTAKLMLSAANILALNMASGITGYIALLTFDPEHARVVPFLVITLYTLLLNLFFGSLGMTIAVAVKRARPMTSFCVGLVLILYFLFTISRITGVEGDFGYISPFKWVNVEVLHPDYGLDAWRIGLFLGFFILLIAFSAMVYRKKDILT